MKEEVDDDQSNGSGSGEGSGDEEVSEDEGLPLMLLILAPTGGFLLFCIPFCIVFRSKACLCRQCC